MGRRLAWWALVAFGLFFVLKNPAGAAHSVHAVLTLASRLASALGTFVSDVGATS